MKSTMIASAAFSMVGLSKFYHYVALTGEVDDLPAIRENLKKGFIETQSTINSWVNRLKKKIDGEEDEIFHGQPVRPAQSYNGGPSRGQYGGRRSGDSGRRSADQERYDADPQVLGDDFTNLQLRDQEGALPGPLVVYPLC